MRMTKSLLELVSAVAPRSQDFRHLASQCFGAWPASILKCLDDLSAVSGPLRNIATRLLLDAEKGLPDRLDPVEGLPPEHPLDGDWRFAAGVPEMVLRKLLAAAGTDGRILLACTPTVVLAAAHLGVSKRVTVAVRDGDPISDALRSTVPDARYLGFEEIWGLEAAAGLIDPPWYDDIAEPLVKRLAGGIRQGGVLLACGPDLMTAPSNAKRLSRSGTSFFEGLVPMGSASRVRYRTPFFESRAMEAIGIRSVPSSWRTGLLRTFVRTASNIAPLAPLTSDDTWAETAYGGNRLWIRASAARGGKPKVVVSDSVSRTSPLRDIAWAWTSANTVIIGGTKEDALGLTLRLSSPLLARLMDMDNQPCWQQRDRTLGKLAPPEQGWDKFHEL